MPPVIPDKLPCESAQRLEEELSTLRDALSLVETEETWDRIARALIKFGAVVKGGGYKYEMELVNGIKASARAIVGAMNSERTRLSAAALDCLIIIAPRVGPAFETLVPLFVPHILRLATRTNKVYVTRSQTGLALILNYCHIPSITPYLLAACKESKIVTGRAVAVEGVLRCLNKWDWTERDIKARVGDVEEVIKVTGRDKDAGIRQTSRQVFEAYKILFPERVDEFTGPLTPVMRKYLDLKPQNLTSKAIEPARLPVQEKPKRPVTRPLFASSTSAISSSTNTRAAFKTHGRSATSAAVVAAGFMPPPASIPSRAHGTSRPQIQRPNPDHHQSEQHAGHERQRVLSTASSTFSVKSAPSNSHPGYEHRPPVRLAVSQSPATTTNPVMAASSGQARRVRRVAAVEPHPANRHDFSTVSHNAPPGSTHVAAMSLSQMQKATQGSGNESVGPAQGALGAGVGIVFPAIEPESAPTAIMRKGAQRVPKPVPQQVFSPPKADRPQTAMSDGVKREVKPSIFRGGAPNALAADEKKKSEKVTEGFAPRRGGGVTQPTLSQLSKQRTLPSASGTRPVSGKTANASVVSKRPVWGAGARPIASKGLQASRVLSRNGVAKAPSAKHGDPATVTKIQPDIGSIPANPDGESDDVPLVMPLSGSPIALRVNEDQTQEATVLDEVNMGESLEVALGSTGSETNSDEIRTDKAQEVVQDTSDKGGPYTFVTEANAPPRTPPYPSADEESDEDELDAIEFTTGDVYDSAGAPIKTPGKVMTNATRGVPPQRNPLAEVVLNG